jgi:hypothetical protein
LIDITDGRDGRKRALPPNPFDTKAHTSMGYGAPKTQSVRDAIAQFEASGHSNHSAMRLLLPYIIEHCERNGYDYTLNCKAGFGYFIRKGNHA